MFNKVYTQHWLELSKETRTHLREVFNIPRTGITEVRDTTIVSDGTTNSDLESITSERMERYVGSKESYPRLWELTLAKVRYELNPPMDLSSLQASNKEELNGKNEENSKEEQATANEPIQRPTFRATTVSTESKPPQGDSPQALS